MNTPDAVWTKRRCEASAGNAEEGEGRRLNQQRREEGKGRRHNQQHREERGGTLPQPAAQRREQRGAAPTGVEDLGGRCVRGVHLTRRRVEQEAPAAWRAVALLPC